MVNIVIYFYYTDKSVIKQPEMALTQQKTDSRLLSCLVGAQGFEPWTPSV